MNDLTVLAIGGHSLLDPELPPTVDQQFAVTAAAMVPVADLVARGERLVLTHGNGPQVGYMLLRSELARRVVHEVPLDSLVADSQGSLGYMIQRALREELRARDVVTEVATIVTEVEVDPHDRAFAEPSKPVGPFYDASEAARLVAEHGWEMMDDPRRGHRRVVPSPTPTAIVQLRVIERLVDAGVTVVCCGGGGIAVTRDDAGHIEGLEAVVDKDRTSTLLAVGLGARRLVVTTGVDRVYRGFASAAPEPIEVLTATEARALAAAGEFPAGSMGPKIEAALAYLDRVDGEVVICSPDQLRAALDGDAGTRIRREEARP